MCHLAVYCTAGFSVCVFSCSDCIRLAVFRLFLQRVSVDFVMVTDSDAQAGARSGITFGVTLEVPWNAPEAYVHLHSVSVVDLLGLAGWRLEAAVIWVLQGRDARSECALIPHPQVLERGFHDVTIVDMVSEDDLSLIRLQWPVTVLRNMVWLQNELDAMHAAAKSHYQHSRPGDCSYCGKWNKCDM